MKSKNLIFPLNLITSLRHPASAAPLLAAVFAWSSPLHASTIWDGGIASPATSPTWGIAENWSDDIAPTFDNVAELSFPTSSVTNFNASIGANRIIRSMSFGADVDTAFGVSYTQTAAGTVQTLTMGGGAGAPSITVNAGSTGAITLGNPFNLAAASVGTMILADNLAVTHNGSGILNFNRNISGATFGLTKTGSGTMQLNSFNTFTGAININQGTLIANSFAVNGEDLNAALAVNLGGGTLQIGASSGTNKTYATVPVNVSTASTLEYRNTNATTTYTASFTGAGAFALNADLAVKNVSTTTTLVNGLNLSRAITGSSDMAITTNNDIGSSGANFSLGRVLLTGNNSAWNGDLTVARGTVSLGGNAVNAAGTGVITIGTVSDAFGAGITFFPQGANGTTVTYANAITVTPGGFRAIKGGGTNHSVTFSGGVTLDGNLTLDHTWGATDRRITLSGAISGAGGLTITRAGGNAGTTITLNGVDKTYTGITTVAAGASLAVSKGLISDISVTGGRFGGNGGSTTKTLSLAAGSTFFFYLPTFAPFNVSGSVTLDKTFGVTSLVGGSQGEAIVWASVPDGTYNLIGTTASTFNHITNVGSANAADVGGGRIAYFQNGGSGGLDLVVTPGVAGYAAWQQANGNTTGDLNADHDDDGVSNGTEFFLGGNTSTTGFTALPGVTNNSVTWVKAPIGYATNYGAGFVVETSDTLAAGSWVTAAEGVGANKVEITGNSVKYTFPAGTKKFARLKVTGPNALQ